MSGTEPGFVTSDDEIDVLIQGVDENEVPSAVDRQGRLVLTAGKFLKVRGRGFTNAGSAEVWMFSTPTLLGRVPKTASGDFAGRVRIPEGMQLGEHTVQLRALTRRGRSVLVSVPAIVIGATRLEWESFPGSQDDVQLGPFGNGGDGVLRVDPGVDEVAIPVGAISRVVRRILPNDVDPSSTRIDVRTPASNWVPVDLSSQDAIRLPIDAATTDVDVRATSPDGRVFEGAITVARASDGADGTRTGVAIVVLLIATAVIAAAIGRRRREPSDEPRYSSRR